MDCGRELTPWGYVNYDTMNSAIDTEAFISDINDVKLINDEQKGYDNFIAKVKAMKKTEPEPEPSKQSTVLVPPEKNLKLEISNAEVVGTSACVYTCAPLTAAAAAGGAKE